MFNINGVFVVKGKDGRNYVVDDHLSGIDMLMSFMHVVIYGEQTYHDNAKSVRRSDLPVAKLLQISLGLLPKFAKLNSSRYHYHPALGFFFEEYRGHQISTVTNVTAATTVHEALTVGDLFNDFIAVMRVKSREYRLKKRISNWEGKYNKGLARIIELVNRVFEERSRVAVIRLDLEYKKTEFTAEEVQSLSSRLTQEHLNEVFAFHETGTFESMEQFKGMVPFEEALADRQRLFGNMKGKPRLFRHLIAAVWQMECTPIAGYHIHVALIFKGSDVRKHEWLAQQIGEYWENVITNGRGRFHNVNRDFDPKSPHYGIGIIEHYDQKKRQNLINSLTYFVKKSQKAAVLPFKGCNLFGAYMVNRLPRTNSGKPRLNREGVALNHHPKLFRKNVSEMCSRLV